VNAPLSATSPGLVSVPPGVLAEIQADFSREWLRLLDQARQGQLPLPQDKRFASPAWTQSGSHLLMAHAYLLSVRALTRMVEAAQVSEPWRDRLRFSVMQWVDALSPANFLAFNPDVQQTIVDTAGEALTTGLANLMQDLRKGRISQTDETQFEIGRNIAVTPGQVIAENELFQLIQYAPQTHQVFERPLVIIPPNINKYYILDLQPSNSFVRHAVQQGQTVFMVSWRNPLPTDTDGIDTATWGDYLETVLKALQIASNITGQERVNALGFCVGGTLLATALALDHARGRHPAESMTLLTSLLDFHDTGQLKVFVDEAHALLRDQQLGKRGIMPGRDLATTFSFLRPNELVWNYVVGNYLKGQTPPAFDLLFWNSDSTNLPGPFFAWYFRHTYLENNLKVPGRVQVSGVPLDLTRLNLPVYLFGAREDHIVPWTSAYASTQLLRGPQRFVLGASGHVAGVISPPGKKRRSYWVSEEFEGKSLPSDSQSWLSQAIERPGSWWPDWTDWLERYAGKRIKPSLKLGNARHRPIERAPGHYLKVRAA